MIKLKYAPILCCLALLFLISPKLSFSAGYDVYVDSGYKDDDSDGSSDKPYRTIEEAAKEGGKIYVKNGTYKENVSLKKNSELSGQSRDKTIIKGRIDAENNNKIKNLTVSGGTYGINASGKIDIENCKIKDAQKIGINLLESSEEASISDSIISGNGKGFYVQRKRSIAIVGNSIYGNSEEGVDIREKVNGTIKKNEITENGEGGIEIIVGGSNITISENIIKKNKTSGIASQFYSFIEKTGSIAIKNNTISKNGKYGFRCGVPSGGAPSGSYWNSSIELKENIIEDNKIEAVDKTCNIIEVVDEEEEKANTIIKSEIESDDPNEEIQNAEIKEDVIQEQLAEQENINTGLIEFSEGKMKEIGETNKIKVFFWGIKKDSLSPLIEKNKEIESQISVLKNMLLETHSQETANLINRQIETLGRESEKINNFIQTQENRFSLFGWISRIFGK